MIHYYVTWSIHVWHDWLISDKIYPWMNLVTYEWVMTWMILVIFIGKVVFICLGVLVNLVSKFQGKPGTITVKHEFNPNGLKFHRGSPWVSILSWLYLKQMKTTFSMNIWIIIWMSKSMNESYERVTTWMNSGSYGWVMTWTSYGWVVTWMNQIRCLIWMSHDRIECGQSNTSLIHSWHYLFVCNNICDKILSYVTQLIRDSRAYNEVESQALFRHSSWHS